MVRFMQNYFVIKEEGRIIYMVYKRLPNTDLVVSAICLGCGTFGSVLDEKMSGALLDAFMFEGGNFIDTANIYGKWVPGKRALSEIILENWLQYKKNRDKLMIGTKGGHPELEAMEVPRLSPQESQGLWT